MEGNLPFPSTRVGGSSGVEEALLMSSRIDFLMKPPLCLTSKRAEPKEHVRAETGVDWGASKLRG